MISMTSSSQPLSSLGRADRASILGIDLGTSSVKMARMEVLLGRWTVSSRLVIPAEESVAGFYTASDIDMLSQQLAVLANRPTESNQECICVLPRSICDFTQIEVPFGSDAEVKTAAIEAIQSQMGDAFQARSFQMWRHSDSAEEMATVSCASYHQAVAQRVMDQLKSVGLKCVGVECHPFAIARACQLSRLGQTNGPIAILDWGHSAVSLMIVMNGQPQSYRLLPGCSAANAIHLVAKQLAIPIDEAQQLLNGCSLPSRFSDYKSDTLSERLLEFMMPEFRKVAEQTQHLLRHLRKNNPQSVPGSMLLMGGMGAIENLAQLLQQLTGIETSSWALDSEHAHASDSVYATAFAASASVDV